MTDLVIVGHGGLAKEVAFLVEEINRPSPTWNLLGYVTAQRECVGQLHAARPIVDTDDGLRQRATPLAVAVAIGQPALARAVAEKLRKNLRLTFPNLIHPRATGDWPRIQQGVGNIVLNGASFTTAIRLGSFNLFNPGVTVAHDCELGDYNRLGPGAHLCGAVVMADEVFVGAGAVVTPGRRLGRGVVLGAGAVVVNDLPEAGTYTGVPARKL